MGGENARMISSTVEIISASMIDARDNAAEIMASAAAAAATSKVWPDEGSKSSFPANGDINDDGADAGRSKGVRR
jgi:hypothetical protein